MKLNLINKLIKEVVCDFNIIVIIYQRNKKAGSNLQLVSVFFIF